MTERPPYIPRRVRGGPSGTALGFWRSLTAGSRVAATIMLAVLLVCLASAVSAPAYRGALATQPAPAFPQVFSGAVITGLRWHRLMLLDRRLEGVLRMASSTGDSFTRELDQLARDAAGAGPAYYASLEVLADGSETPPGDTEGLESRASEVADLYEPTYGTYLAQVAAISEALKRSEVHEPLDGPLRESIEACDTAASSLTTSLGALSVLRGGDAAAITAAGVEASRASALLEEGLEKLGIAIKDLESSK